MRHASGPASSTESCPLTRGCKISLHGVVTHAPPGPILPTEVALPPSSRQQSHFCVVRQRLDILPRQEVEVHTHAVRVTPVWCLSTTSGSIAPEPSKACPRHISRVVQKHRERRSTTASDRLITSQFTHSATGSDLVVGQLHAWTL